MSEQDRRAQGQMGAPPVPAVASYAPVRQPKDWQAWQRRLATAAMLVGGIGVAGLAISLVAMIWADREMPGAQAAALIGGVTAVLLGLPLLGAAALGTGMGVVALGSSLFRRPQGRERRHAFAGGMAGIAAIFLLLPINRVGIRLQNRTVFEANMGGVGQVLRQYADQHEGCYPPSLDTLVESGLARQADLRCPYHFYGGPNTCYEYVSGQRLSDDPRNVVLNFMPGCLSSRGVHVLFLDGHIEWVAPYSRVQKLVEQTKQRLEVKAVQTRPAPVARAASQPAP